MHDLGNPRIICLHSQRNQQTSKNIKKSEEQKKWQIFNEFPYFVPNLADFR